jgi:hypothetical protein
VNYQQHYNLLILRAKDRILDGYTEKHHIIPRCMNGTDDDENIAILTAREHFLAHLLLVKIYPTERKLLFSARMMSGNPTGKRNTNKTYAWIRERISTLGHTEETKKKIGRSGKDNAFYGKTHSEETKQHQAEVMKGRLVGEKNGFYGKTHSDETKQKIIKSNKSRTHSEEARLKIGEASRNRVRKPMSEETKRKISEAAKRRKNDK